MAYLASSVTLKIEDFQLLHDISSMRFNGADKEGSPIILCSHSQSNMLLCLSADARTRSTVGAILCLNDAPHKQDHQGDDDGDCSARDIFQYECASLS